MNQKEIIERLKIYIGITQDNVLGEKLNISPSTLSSWRTGRTMINISRILEFFPEINIDWLMKGENTNGVGYISLRAFQNICKGGGIPPTVLIPEKAKAGYSSGFSQDGDVELPIIHLKHYTNGSRYRFFEISGRSMLPTFEEGDYVLCELVGNLRALKQKGLYILHTESGLLCKRLEIKDTCLLLHSDNPDYPSKKTLLDEIKEYWCIISFFRNLP